jgi:hypothetical protein
MKAVSDSIAFIPEFSLTERNQASFANRATYLDNHRLGINGMNTTLDEVLAEQNIHSKSKCVRIDPCPDPPFKDLECCGDKYNHDVSIEPKELPPYPLHAMRDYPHKDSTWRFMIDPERPWDRIAMVIMGVAVGIGIVAVLGLLIWSMVWKSSSSSSTSSSSSSTSISSPGSPISPISPGSPGSPGIPVSQGIQGSTTLPYQTIPNNKLW